MVIAQAIFAENKCSHSTARVVADLLESAFSKATRLQPLSTAGQAMVLEMATHFFNSMLSPKAPTISVMAALLLFARLYSCFLPQLSGNLLLSDLVVALIKLYKKQSEWYVKERVLDTLAIIVQRRPPKLDASAADILRFVAKVAHGEKFVFPLCALMRLLAALTTVLNPALLASHFELIANALLSAAEDSTRLLRVFVARAFAALFSRVGLTWSGPVRKKVDMPKSFGELLDWLARSALFTKQTRADSLRIALLDGLQLLLADSAK